MVVGKNPHVLITYHIDNSSRIDISSTIDTFRGRVEISITPDSEYIGGRGPIFNN